MASVLSALLAFLPSLKRRSSTTRINQIRCNLEEKQRRSARYHPPIWETKHIQSLDTPYTYELHAGRLEELKQITRGSIPKSTKDHIILLKLIDSLRRLGLAYHFEGEIREALSRIHQDKNSSNDLCITALRFRVLREHGLSVSSDIFDRFRGHDGRFLNCLISDVVGLLNLYETSYLGMPKEIVLEEAKSFTKKKLKNSLTGGMDCYLAKQLQQSLEIPLN